MGFFERKCILLNDTNIISMIGKCKNHIWKKKMHSFEWFKVYLEWFETTKAIFEKQCIILNDAKSNDSDWKVQMAYLKENAFRWMI